MKLRSLIVAMGTTAGAIALASVALLVYQTQKTTGLAATQVRSQDSLSRLHLSRQTCDGMKVRALSWALTRRAAQRNLYDTAKAACTGNMAELVKVEGSAQPLLAELVQFTQLMEEVAVNMTEETRNAATAQFQRQAEPVGKKIDEEFIKLQDALALQSRAALEQLSQGNKEALYAIALACLLALGLAGGILLVVARKVVLPVVHATASAHTLAAGDLTSSYTSERRDEIGDMLNSLEQVRAAWVDALRRVKATTDSIYCASGDIVRGSQDLSGRTSQQAASLQQTASSMHQINATVNSNADNASKATELAAAVSQVAGLTGEQMQEMVQTMTEIREASKRISEVTSAIDDITFKTNLLALNAAVEAARAGQFGRGFAVVASEVRSLANSANEAAQEIRVLVSDSATRVKDGSKRMSLAATSMQELVAQVQNVSQLVGEIAHSTVEQRAGIDLVTQSMAELDSVTQSNASMVEDSSAAATSLKQQVEVLNDVVSVFRLPDSEDADYQGAAELAEAEV